jgi:hypothetical protein
MRVERSHVEHALCAAGLGDVRVVQTGIGKDALVRAIARAGSGPGACLFVLAGACGGLGHGEDVPPIARVVDEHGRTWTPWGAEKNGAALAAVDHIVSTPADKQALAERTGASIVDMESHAFAARCEEMGIAWSVVRGVSDTPDETLPHEVLGWITPEGDTRTGRAMLDMVRRPSLVPHIVGVMRRSNRVLPLVGKRVVEIIRRWERERASSDGRAQ